MDLQPGEGAPISESAYSQGEGNLYQRVLIARGRGIYIRECL